MCNKHKFQLIIWAPYIRSKYVSNNYSYFDAAQLMLIFRCVAISDKVFESYQSKLNVIS